MSTLRNAAPRRPHRERAQPGGRAKWGLLEKHKDYSLRAADYNLKQKKLAQLTQKARERHPDEFAFGMMGEARGRQGRHSGKEEGNRLSHGAVELLKSQDAGYLRVVAGRGRKEIERVKEEIGMAAGGMEETERRKKVFVDDDEGREGEGRGKKRNADGDVLFVEVEGGRGQGEDDVGEGGLGDGVSLAEDGDSLKPKSKKALAVERRAVLDLRLERKRRKRRAEARANKLEALKKRQVEIMAVADQLELQRAKMARTVGGVNKNGVKFKIRERKR